MGLDATAGGVVGPFPREVAEVPTSIGHALFFCIAAAGRGIYDLPVAVEVDVGGASLVVDFAGVSALCPTLPSVPGGWAMSFRACCLVGAHEVAAILGCLAAVFPMFGCQTVGKSFQERTLGI